MHTEHAVQTASSVEIHAELVQYPFPHTVHGVHALVAPYEYVLAIQAVHVLAATPENVPASQSVHVLDPEADVYDPAKHESCAE